MIGQESSMIVLDNVTKFYRIKEFRHYVLRDVSYTFNSGLSIGILGKNGAGKSTLLRMLGGIEYPNFGRIIISGSISWPVGLTAGFLPALSARENIKFVCRIYGKTGLETKKIVDYVRDFAEIGDHFDMPISSYSSGMKGRVNFGLSMAFDFDYYLVDEVTGVGDPSFKKKAADAFNQKRKNAAMVMVSHDMKTLRDTCDIGIYLHDGKIDVYEDLEEAIKLYQQQC